MWNSKACILGFLVAFVAWCQAESFSIGTRVTSVQSAYARSKRVNVVDLRHNAAFQIRGGGIVSSAKSMWETLPSGSVPNSLAKMLHTFVDPAITGGLLSGGLHAVTGTSIERLASFAYTILSLSPSIA